MSRKNYYVSGRELFSTGLILLIFYIFGADLGLRESFVNILKYICLGCFVLSIILSTIELRSSVQKAAPYADKVGTVIHIVLALSAFVLALLWHNIFQ